MAALLAMIGSTLATDQFRGFMLWREEQRAIGELMARSPGTDADQGAGYSDFVLRYDDTFRTWFAPFTQDLTSRGARLQELLSELVGRLDERGDLVQRDTQGRTTGPGWMARAEAA